MSYKEGTLEFWIKVDKNPSWLKNRIGYKLFDGPVGDAKVRIEKTSDMKLYVEHYHPISYIRTLSYDISSLHSEKDHYIALTWTPIELILYIDGKPVAKIESALETVSV